MSRPVAQNFPSFQPTELYAQSGRVGAFGFNWVAGRRVRIYPGGRKAATAAQSISLRPIFAFSDEIKESMSSSHPIGILPGRVKS
jgi:hypothetical protein